MVAAFEAVSDYSAACLAPGDSFAAPHADYSLQLQKIPAISV
jgi:hypothetical protein